MRRILLWGALCMLPAAPAWTLSEAAWLYSVERPVTAQTTVERDRAAGEALLVVLSRLSGLKSVPRTEVITGALASPGRFYNQFLFFSKRDEMGADAQYLRVTFEADAIQGLIKDAELPVWWSKRPRVVAWIAAEDGGRREILSAAGEHPLVEALQARARERGLSLTLPLMDLGDTLAVSAADVWGKLRPSLDAGAVRYDADLVLIGRMSRIPPGFAHAGAYRGDWEIWLDGRPLADTFTGLAAAEAALLGVDMVADQLAERYAVLPREPRVQRLAIGGLDDPGSYAEFMRYLEAFEFVDEVEVTAIDALTLHVELASRAQTDQLLMLLMAEGKLARDKLYRGFDTRLVWRG